MMNAVTDQRKCSDLVEGDLGAALSVTGFAGESPLHTVLLSRYRLVIDHVHPTYPPEKTTYYSTST